MTEPDPIDNAATQFQDEGDEYVAWTAPVTGRVATPDHECVAGMGGWCITCRRPVEPGRVTTAEQRIAELARLLLWCEERHQAVQHADVRAVLGIPAPLTPPARKATG